MDSQACYRSPAKSPHKKIYDDLMVKLRNELQANGVIDRMEYVGSQYKKTGIDASDYDNLFIKRDKNIEVQIYDSTNSTYVHLLRVGGQLNPKQELQTFRSHVHKVMNKLNPDKKLWRVAEHGCAMELRYGPDLFSVDLVFCYEVFINGKLETYSAKPPRNASGQEAMCWKLSTATEEKACMSKIDRENTSCRRAIRVLKAIRDAYPTLHVLTSYTIEQTFFASKELKHVSFWSASNEQPQEFKEIVRFLLQQLESKVETGILYNYYNSYENVMPEMSSITRSNVVYLLKRLSRDPKLDRVLEDIVYRVDAHEAQSESSQVSDQCHGISPLDRTRTSFSQGDDQRYGMSWFNTLTEKDSSTDEEEMSYQMRNVNLADDAYGGDSMLTAQREDTSSGLGWALALGAVVAAGIVAFDEYKKNKKILKCPIN